MALNKETKTTNNPLEIRICCPFCSTRGKGEDTGFHLYIHTQKCIFNCFRCGASGKSRELGLDEETYTDIVTPNINTIISKISNLFKVKKPIDINLDIIGWKIDKNKTPIAYEYMRSRGFSDEDLTRYNIYVGKKFVNEKDEIDRRWEGRVLFPFVENDEVKMVVGRTYVDQDPKYRNSEGNKSNYVYGLDTVTGNECIICEGIISAIAASRYSGVPAVAILGKYISDTQASKIREKCNKVIVSLDGDVSREESKKMIYKLMGAGFIVEEIRLPDGKDPDELKGEYTHFFNNRITGIF